MRQPVQLQHPEPTGIPAKFIYVNHLTFDKPTVRVSNQMKPPHYLQTIISIAFLLLFAGSTFAQQKRSIVPQSAVYQQKLQSSALLFMENQGQVSDDKGHPQPDILFVANSSGAKIYLTATGIHYQFTKTEYPKGYHPISKEPVKNPEKENALRQQIKVSTHRFTVALQGANLHPVVNKQGQSRYYENYYLPQCSNGITGVHGYEKVIFKNVYPDIDWVVYSKGGFMEYDFLVHPGGNPANIKLKITDADKVSTTPQGELLMQTTLGEVKEKAPVSYLDGHIVPSRFKQNKDGTIGLAVQAQPGKELRIDPSIVWSTYYGGGGDDGGYSCSTDANSNIFMTGYAQSPSNIASGGFQSSFGGLSDAFLIKLDSNGNRLWSTYYGGSGLDIGYSCVTDANNNCYVAGYTASSNSIASNGFQNTIGGGNSTTSPDAFLVKFNEFGIRTWATYYGGSNGETGWSCETDLLGNVYLAGSTGSSSGIAFNGFQNSYGSGTNNSDAFIAKFDGSGNRIWATYYGGSDVDYGYSCSIDNNGYLYLAGETQSATGIASNGFQNTFGGGFRDAFLVKFDLAGNRIWATYYGGYGADYGHACKNDKAGNVYLCGYTASNTGIAFNGFQNSYVGLRDAFLVKFNSSGNRIWGTYFGGGDNEDGITCAVDSSYQVYLAGYTYSNTNLSFNGFQNTPAYAYIVKFGSAGNRIWSSYFGGNNYTVINACTIDRQQNVYMSGYTIATTGIAFNGFQDVLGGGNSNSGDAFLSKISESACIRSTNPTITTNYDTVCTGATPTLTVASGNLNSATHWQWYTGSCGGTSIGNTSSITVTPAATTTYYLRGEGGCVTPSTCVSKTIYVKPAPVATFAASPIALCADDTLTVTFTGSAPPNAAYSWNWGGGRIISGTGFGPYRVVYNTPGSIGLTVSNGTCSVAASTQNINPVAVPEVALSVSDSVGCSPQRITLSAASINGNNWIWDFGDGATLSNINTPVEHTYAAGTYMPSLTVYRGNCSNKAVKTIRIHQRPTAAFSVQPGPNTPVSLSQANFVFTNASQNASRYLWRFGDSESSTLANPVHRYTTSGIYTASLYAYNAGNCADTFELKSFIIKADTIAGFTIPSAFSPNGDGINDSWVIAALQQYSNCRVSIYNRWGQAVFNSTGYTRAWDGKYNGKPLPVDTYYYVMTLENKSYTGSVLLLR